MSPRQKLTLPFGGGLDRKTGLAVVDPDAMADLRNVYVFKGRIMLRKGMARVLDIGWGTDIIGIFSVRAQGLAAVVVFDDVSLAVRLYVVDGSLETASLVGTLWTIDATAQLPPIVTGADLYDYLILAHGESVFSMRGATKAVNVNALTIANYTSDLDRDAVAETVKFFGVTRHLNSLIGWGYGTGADEDRPEVLRISKPGAPLTLVPESYFLVGNKGDPIIGAARSGSLLEVMKTAETHFLTGNGPKTFDIEPGDTNFGLLAPQLYTVVVDTLYRWSLEGPRVSKGGPSNDLEMLLNLAGPLPDATAGEDDGFAYYDATQGEVVFVFGAWAYVLHLKDGARRWSYRELGVVLQSAGRIFEGGAATLSLPEAILGALSLGSGADPLDPEPTLTVPWTIVGTLGGTEDVEVWAKPSYTGVWALKATVAAAALTTPAVLAHWLTNHDIAIRVVIAGTPGAGYTGSPDLWPATARGAILTTLALTSVLQGAWHRLSGTRPAHKIDFAGPGMGGVHPELSFVLEYSTDAGGAWNPGTGSPYAAIPLYAEHLNANVNVTTYRNRLKIIGPDADTGFVDGAVDRLFEPRLPSGLVALPDIGGGAGHMHPCSAGAGETGADLDLKARHLPAGTMTAISTVANPPGIANLDVATDAAGNVEISARSSVTAFAVTDVSSWVVQNTGVL